MPIRATCPECRNQYDLDDGLAGQSVRCRVCGKEFPVPPVNDVPFGGGDPPGMSAPPGGGYPGSAPPNSGDGPLKVAAILNLVMAGFALLWSLLMLFYVAMSASGAMAEEMRRQGNAEMPEEMMVLLFLGLFAFAFIAGAIGLTAGVKMLKHSPGAWKWGMTAAIINVLSLFWGCCLLLLGVPVGIVGIVILLRDDVRRLIG